MSSRVGFEVASYSFDEPLLGGFFVISWGEEFSVTWMGSLVCGVLSSFLFPG